MSGQRPQRWRGDRPPRRPYPANRNRNPQVSPEVEERIRELDSEREPLSLAEEISVEHSNNSHSKLVPPPADGQSNRAQSSFAELQHMSPEELLAVANAEQVRDAEKLSPRELVFQILKASLKNHGLMFGEGTLEILPDGFGFLRSAKHHYLSCPDDIYVSPSQIRRFGLQTGASVAGQIRPPKENERYFALLRVEAINYHDPDMRHQRIPFDSLTPLHPDQRIVMETASDVLETRVVDLIAPIGFGQRGLIVSPPRAGKTILMQKMARAVLKNYPDAYVMILLIDERPEEVTDMAREVRGPNCEVVSSTFDEPTARHIQVAHMVLEKAKRMVEYGVDVVIFLDSITRFARAWNSECPQSGKLLTGGLGCQRIATSQVVLRFGAQGGRRWFIDHYRYRTCRYRQPHGRRDLRRVQRNWQSRNRA